jgi:signal recognition particle GTPase
MELADYYRERAAHYRRLAAGNGTLRQHFKDLARQYNKLAEAMAAAKRDQPDE